MSIRVMTAVWSTDLPHVDKLVLLALADNANDEGDCWPSTQTLATKCGMEQRSITRVMERLQAAGHLTRQERPGRSNTYRVHPRLTVTPDGGSPLTQGPTTPDPQSPTPDGGSPPDKRSSYLESSSEPSGNRREVRASRSTRATRLPDDFGLTPERRAVAEAEKADPDREFASFTDHFRAAPGVKGRKNDWDATWRNWCRRAPDFKPRANGLVKPAWVAPITAEEAEARERARGEIP